MYVCCDYCTCLSLGSRYQCFALEPSCIVLFRCLQDDVLNANCELRAEVDKVLELRKCVPWHEN